MPETKKKRKRSQKQRRAMKRYAVVLTALVAVIAVLTGMTIAGRVNRADPLDALPSDIRDDGSLRVYLKSLARPDALGLTLDGIYTVESDAGFRFARGTELTVAVNKNNLLLSAGGLTIDMGPSFTLTRHAPEDGNNTNGLYIHESERDALYAGDLKLVNSGQGIDAYLTISMEDYLYGVVAYEMSDSFPLEALKAQAVAARTYAMRAKWNAGSREYDVVDTTADQVYKGYDPIYTRVIQAVNETRGIVGMANGTFAGCYYTASNGGQVASAKQIWGGSGAEYIEMKDDPYDLENPSSVVKRARVERKPAANGDLTDADRRADGHAHRVGRARRADGLSAADQTRAGAGRVRSADGRDHGEDSHLRRARNHAEPVHQQDRRGNLLRGSGRHRLHHLLPPLWSRRWHEPARRADDGGRV